MESGEQKIWQPDEIINPLFGTESKAELIKKYESTVNPETVKKVAAEWYRLAHERKLSPFELQHRLAKMLIRILEWYAAEPEEEEKAREELTHIYQYYEWMIFQGENWDMPDLNWSFGTFKSGFMAEYAVAKAICQGGHQVYYPSEKDDNVLKVDWWVVPKYEDPENGRVWGVQVKNVSGFLNEFPWILDPASREEMDDVKLKLFSRTPEYGRNFQRAINQMVFNCQRFSNVDPKLIIVPGSSFDSVTGKPRQDLDIFLNQEIDVIYGAFEKGQDE